MKCPKCGNELASDDRFCNKCGCEIKLRCPKCGKEVSDEDVFCEYCGQRLKPVANSQPTPAPTPTREEAAPRRSQHQETKSKFDYRIIGIVAVVAVIVVAAAYLIFFRGGSSTSDSENSKVKVVETNDKELTVDDEVVDIDVNETQKIVANLANVKYESQDDTIATVSSKGEIRGIKQGNTKVIATKGKQKVTIDVYVADHTATSSNGDYIFPNSATTQLTDSDLNGKTAWELRIARNEIYARHGREFQDATLKQYFESKSWYQVSSSYSDAQLSSVEKKNAEFISAYEKSH